MINKKPTGSILTLAYKNQNDYNINNSFVFAEQFQNFQLPEDFVLVSLDVVSLFTNIPTNLIIEIVNEDWSNKIEPCCNLSKEKILTILTIILDWYGNPTHSARFINFYSCNPLNQKLNVLISFKNRIKLCHPTFLKKNLIKL